MEGKEIEVAEAKKPQVQKKTQKIFLLGPGQKVPVGVAS
jgi:hypothetical protein